MVFDELPEKFEGTFDSSLLTNYRLDTIHKQIHLSRVNRYYQGWYEWLICFYMELSRIMKSIKLKNEVHSEYEEFEKELFKLKEAYKNIIGSIKKPYGKIDPFHIQIFYDFEIKLGRFEQEANLAIGKRPDKRYAMSN